jgi:hypothetical protein
MPALIFTTLCRLSRRCSVRCHSSGDLDQTSRAGNLVTGDLDDVSAARHPYRHQREDR